MNKQSESPVISLLRHLWSNGQKGTSHSWLRFNQGMRAGLFLAVEMGYKFELGDLETAMKDFNGGYWIGATGFEDFYRASVAYRNASAWKCLEGRKGRKPFIVKGATLHCNYGGGRMGGGLSRLVVGAEFTWDGECVKVTSFDDQDGVVFGCSSTRSETKHCASCKHMTTWPKESIKQRYRISHADIKAARAKK